MCPLPMLRRKPILKFVSGGVLSCCNICINGVLTLLLVHGNSAVLVVSVQYWIPASKDGRCRRSITFAVISGFFRYSTYKSNTDASTLVRYFQHSRISNTGTVCITTGIISVCPDNRVRCTVIPLYAPLAVPATE